MYRQTIIFFKTNVDHLWIANHNHDNDNCKEILEEREYNHGHITYKQDCNHDGNRNKGKEYKKDVFLITTTYYIAIEIEENQYEFSNHILLYDNVINDDKEHEIITKE